MSANTVRLLRILAVVAFCVGLVLLVLGDDPAADRADWIMGCILAGLALFSFSFAT